MIKKITIKGEVLSMSNNLRKLEKDLRAMAKRCKEIKYTRGLLLLFLLSGITMMYTLLIIFGIIFGIGHIYIVSKNKPKLKG